MDSRLRGNDKLYFKMLYTKYDIKLFIIYLTIKIIFCQVNFYFF